MGFVLGKACEPFTFGMVSEVKHLSLFRCLVKLGMSLAWSRAQRKKKKGKETNVKITGGEKKSYNSPLIHNLYAVKLFSFFLQWPNLALNQLNKINLPVFHWPLDTKKPPQTSND